MSNEIWLTDLSTCEPRHAISREVEPGKWLAVDYEVEMGKGVMVFAVPDACSTPR